MHTDNTDKAFRFVIIKRELKMSEVGNQANTAPVAAAVKAATSPKDDFAARFEKKGKIICRFDASDEEKQAFLETAAAVQAEEEANFHDWTDKAPKTFGTFALVRRENDMANILISMASPDEMFADPTVRNYMYRLAVNKITNAADVDDSTEARFITVAGCFNQKLDLDAFKASARYLVQILHAKGLTGVTISSLKQAFQNAAFATSQFPRVPSETWVGLIGVARALAEKKGFDVSVFDYWLKTRDVVLDEGSELDLGDLSKLGEDVENAIAAKQTDKEVAPAAPATAATA